MFRRAPHDADRVVLRHQRIYILPSRRGIAFLGTWAVMLLTSLNYAMSLGFAVTFVLLGLVAAALLHTYRNLAGVEVRPLAAGEAFAGGTLPFTIALTGGPGIRRGFTLATRDATSAVFDIPAATAVSVTLERPVPRRGVCALGRVTVASSHPLGLWRAWAYVHFALEGIVYPAPEAAAPPLPAGDHGHDARIAARGAEDDLAGVRDYQTGDPLQRVAWKAVARGGGWYSKQFEGSGGSGATTLDWRMLPRELGVEGRIARLAAWVLAAERTARPFALRLPSGDLAVGQGRDHRRHALTALALLPDHTVLG